MKIIHIKGTAFQRGLEYGKKMRKYFSLLHFYLTSLYLIGIRLLMPDIRKGFPTRRYLLTTFLNYKKYRRKISLWLKKYEKFIRKNWPWIIEEMKGLAKGACIEYNDVLFGNILLDALLSCSVWVACGNCTKNKEMLLGMNYDVWKIFSKYQVILIVEPKEGYKYVGCAPLGRLVPVSGINEKGLGIGQSTLLIRGTSLGSSSKKIPPLILHYFLYNKCANIQEALKIFKSLPPLFFPVGLFIVDKYKAARIEFINNRIWNIETMENGCEGICNLPLSININQENRSSVFILEEFLNASYRHKRLQQCLERFKGKMDERIMMKIAQDHGEEETKGRSICQHTHSFFGFQSVWSIIIQPRDLKVWIAKGPPCKYNYYLIRL